MVDAQLAAYKRTRYRILCIRAEMGYQDAIEALRVEFGKTVDPRHAPAIANTRVEQQ